MTEFCKDRKSIPNSYVMLAFVGVASTEKHPVSSVPVVSITKRIIINCVTQLWHSHLDNLLTIFIENSVIPAFTGVGSAEEPVASITDEMMCLLIK